LNCNYFPQGPTSKYNGHMHLVIAQKTHELLGYTFKPHHLYHAPTVPAILPGPLHECESLYRVYTLSLLL
jgi:hypothetical protein